MERLDKVISSQTNYSRKDVKELIKQKKVMVNNNIVFKSDLKVDELRDEIIVNNEKIIIKKNIYLILNKPKGYVSATKDNFDKTVLDFVPLEFKKRNIFNLVRGLIVGKPMDEKYYDEYKDVYRKVFADLDTPVLFNVNFGHSVPRCLIPYDAEVTIDYDNRRIFINNPILQVEQERQKNKGI